LLIQVGRKKVIPWYFCHQVLLMLLSQRLLYWKGCVPRGGVQMVEPGIIFFVGLLCLACLFVRRTAMIAALEQHGVRVVATITGIEAHAMFTRVTACWQHPQTWQAYPCHSWMLFNPLSLQKGKAGASPGGSHQLPALLHTGGTLTVACMSIWLEMHQRGIVPDVL
jgi:hypothetical protein